MKLYWTGSEMELFKSSDKYGVRTLREIQIPLFFQKNID